MPGTTLLFSTLMSDDAKSIARGLRRRDPDLLDRLIEQYQYRLFRYLVYVTGNQERAEDFFQETWVRVLERGHQYDGKSKFEAWLFAIARHLVIDWQRSKKAQSLDTLTDPEQGHPLQLVTFRHLCRKYPPYIARCSCCASRKNCRSKRWLACSAFRFQP